MHVFLSVSVSYCTSGILVWSNEIVQGLQEEDEYRKPGMYMWSFNWMDCVAHCVLCALWNLRWDRWRATWFWRWIHSGPSSHWDRCHPSSTVYIDIPFHMWIGFCAVTVPYSHAPSYIGGHWIKNGRQAWYFIWTVRS